MSLIVSAAPWLAAPPPALSVATGLAQGNGGQNWTPLQLPDVRTHHDAALGVTLSGLNCQSWADQSGNGFHVTQAVATKQPRWVQANRYFNRRPSMRSTSAAATVMKAAAGSRPFALGEARTILSVVRTLTAANNTLCNFQDAAQDWGFNVLSYGAYVWGNGPQNIFTTAPAYPNTVNRLMYAIHLSPTAPGGALGFRENGTTYTGISGNPLPTEVGPGGFMIFARQTGATQPFDGDLAEMTTCAGILSESDLARWVAYVNAKYLLNDNVYQVGPLTTKQPLQLIDAALGVSLNAGNVATIADQSGNAFDMKMATAARQPIFCPSGSGYAAYANNQPVVLFDGADDWLSSSYDRSEPHTVVIFARYMSNAAGSLFDAAFTSANRCRVYRNGVAQIDAGNGSVTQLAVPQSFLESFHTHVFCFNGANGTYSRSTGVAGGVVTVPLDSGSPGAADGLALASLAAGQYFGNVLIGGSIVYPGAVNSTEIQALIDYGWGRYNG